MNRRRRPPSQPISRFSLVDSYWKVMYRKNPVLFVQRELGEIPSPDQAQLLMDMANLDYKYIIISSGRGAGKTKVVSWIVAWSKAVLPDVFGGRYDCNILGGSQMQSNQMNEYFQSYIPRTRFLNNILQGDPKASETAFTTGKVRALPASDRAVRAPHIDLLCLDEVCSASDELMESAMPQITGARHGRLILLSTPHKFFGLFRKYWDNAERLGFRKYGPWSQLNCHWIDKQQIEFFKTTYSSNRYRVEILGEFPDIGYSVWSQEEITQAIAPEPFTYNPNYDAHFGVDWGQAAPFASVLTPIQYIQGKTYIPGPPRAWELEKYNIVVKEIIRTYKAHRGVKLYPDSSHSYPCEMLEENGVNTERVKWTAELKDEMVDRVSELLFHGTLVISPDQEPLIDQMRMALWEVNERTGQQKLKKQSGDDDHVDALLAGLKGLKYGDDLVEKEPDLPVAY